MALEPGFAVTPHVRLLRQLGEGGMGSVWVAEHLTLHTEVAVKFVSEDSASELGLKRFSREAALAAQIKSPHVVQTYDHGATEDGRPYIVMELLEGESLQDRLERGALHPRRAAMVVSQVGKALARAHERGIIHRDLKPANLFLVQSGYEVFVKVLDFGIAKRTGDASMELTDAKSAVGTPFYMSPEALRARDDLDHRADLWSLSVVAYHMLTGRLPFRGATLGDQLLLVHEGRYAPPSNFVELQDTVDGWFATAFHNDIEQRFQNTKQLAKTFRLSLGDAPSQTGMEDAPVTRGPYSDPTSGHRSVSQEEEAPTEPVISTDSDPILPLAGAKTSPSNPPVRSKPARRDETVTSGAVPAQTGIPDPSPSLEELDTLTSSSSVDTAIEPAIKSSIKSSSAGKPITFEGATTSQPLPMSKGSNRNLVFGALGVAALVAGYFGLKMTDEPSTPAAPASASITAAVTGTMPQTAAQTGAASATTAAPDIGQAASAKPAAVVEVALTIDSTPARVKVLDIKKNTLGTAPGPIKLPKSDKPVTLIFLGPKGYATATIQVVPDDHKTVKVALRLKPSKAQPEQIEW